MALSGSESTAPIPVSYTHLSNDNENSNNQTDNKDFKNIDWCKREMTH